MKSTSKAVHVVIAAGILGLLISGFAVAGTNGSISANKTKASSSVNSDQLASQGAEHYAAAGAKVDPDGVVATTPSSYGLDVSRGSGDGVRRSAPGTYVVSLPNTSNKYLFQATGNTGGVDISCSIVAVSDASGDATITCTNSDGNLTDASFYVSATIP